MKAKYLQIKRLLLERNKIIPKRVISFLFLIMMLTHEMGAQVRVSGIVKDNNGEILPYTTVRIVDSSYGCITDNNGIFSFMGPVKGTTLLISSIGYQDVSIELSPSILFPLTITMEPTNYDLNEIQITSKRERYSKKDNPAVDLINILISKKREENPEMNSYLSKDRYEKFVVALDNFNEEKQGKKLFKRFDFLKNYVDTSLVSGKPILNVSIRELVATDYYQQKPEKRKQVVSGRNWVGIDDFMNVNEIQAAVEETLVDLDLFNDKVIILRNEFVSPLSTIAPSYYKFYLMDTITIDGVECSDLAFVPNNPQSYGFTGHLYVTTDSTHFIKWIQMNVPYDINLNFVEYMNIEQKFERDSIHPRLLVYESLTTELKLYDFIDGIYGHREVSYSNYKFNQEVDHSIFNRAEKIIESDDAINMDQEFWAARRGTTLTEKQLAVEEMLKQLREVPIYFWTEKVVSFLFTGYIPIKQEKTPYYYGPANTTISYNELEGVRLRTGGMTTAYLNPNLFGYYYLVYGTRDKRWKYLGRLEYSFKPKKENWNEFPIHSLRLQYENDIFQYGQNYLYTNKDNMFLSLKRLPDNKIGYIRLGELTYTNEFYNGISYTAVLRSRSNEKSIFIPLDRRDALGNIVSHNKIFQTEFELNLRYAPNEKFVQNKWDRNSMLPEHPVFTLTHSISKKGVLGSDYTIQKTEASYRQRLWVSPFGYFDLFISGGKIWDQAPYPLLIIPNANLSYTLRKESFELMSPMEFLLDTHASWDIEYYLNGWLLNRLPIIKKLKLREIITYRGVWGTLSDYNNPNIDNSGNIFLLPTEAIASDMRNTPYAEIGFGIENIFKFGRIDYFKRLTHKNTPGVDTSGIRISVHIQF
ncbi:MAG TPA: DUF5686 family protein [Bacteroidaceae bacterium]|nr:DUF5686 family protein [Bacteroidaceae bacterium]